MTICLIDESKDVTQKQICDALHIPKSTVHSILLEFIRRGYVSLAAGNNKKEKFVVFTPEGSAHFSKVLEEAQRFEDHILSSLGEKTCAFLLEIAESLGKIVTQEIAQIGNAEVSE